MNDQEIRPLNKGADGMHPFSWLTGGDHAE